MKPNGKLSGQDVGRPDGLPIGEAARRMGLTVTALRKRIHRGTTPAYKGADGCWYVVIAGQDVGSPAGAPAGSPAETHRRSVDYPHHSAGSATGSALAEALRDEVVFLRHQLEAKDAQLVARVHEASEQISLLRDQLQEKDQQIAAWIDEAKRKDMLIAHLQERIVELPTSTSEPHSDPPDNTQDKPEPRQEPAAPIYSYRIPEPATRPWWQFWRRKSTL